MINAEKGIITTRGDKIELLVDLATIIATLSIRSDVTDIELITAIDDGIVEAKRRIENGKH